MRPEQLQVARTAAYAAMDKFVDDQLAAAALQHPVFADVIHSMREAQRERAHAAVDEAFAKAQANAAIHNAKAEK